MQDEYKVKVKFSLCLTKHHAMKIYWEWRDSSTHSLPQHWMEVSGQLHAPATLLPGKEPPGTHWIGGWVGPRAGLDMVEKRKFSIWTKLLNPTFLLHKHLVLQILCC
jgi:hypothetical protein